MRTIAILLALGAAGLGGEAPDSWIYFDNATSVHMSGSTRDLERARRAVGDHRGMWLTHDGKAYVITYAKLLARVDALAAPVEELGRKQGELGRKQGELGRKQDELGRKQGELGRRMGELARAGSEREMDALGRQMDALGREQDALGRQQDALGAQQDALGREQERASATMDAKLKELFQQAIASGQAKPAP